MRHIRGREGSLVVSLWSCAVLAGMLHYAMAMTSKYFPGMRPVRRLSTQVAMPGLFIIAKVLEPWVGPPTRGSAYLGLFVPIVFLGYAAAASLVVILVSGVLRALGHEAE